MKHIHYRNDELYCEGIPVTSIAKVAGTPVYIYSKAHLLETYRAIERAFQAIETTICFSVKSCSNLAILRLLAEAGSGFDIVSGGELFRVVKAGGDPGRVVYAGVGKTEEEIRYALEQGILLFNVESEAEMARIDRVAGDLGVSAAVALRLNPDVDPKTHRKTTTGKKENKFGVDLGIAGRIVDAMASFPHVSLKGLDVHLGSPINSVAPYAKALDKVIAFKQAHPALEATLEYINCGGGFGLLYRDEDVPSFDAYAATIVPRVQALGCRLILEPGRSIAGNAGILIGTVQYKKCNGEKTFIIVDAGMQTLMRPAMYDSYHGIWPVRGGSPNLPAGTSKNPGLIPTDVVGPICESSDVFCKDRPLPPMDGGDYVAFFSAGAYGFSMSNQYNSHPRAPEVLVDGETWSIIRTRETYEDLISRERLEA